MRISNALVKTEDNYLLRKVVRAQKKSRVVRLKEGRLRVEVGEGLVGQKNPNRTVCCIGKEEEGILSFGRVVERT